jgi:hypothetical protein
VIGIPNVLETPEDNYTNMHGNGTVYAAQNGSPEFKRLDCTLIGKLCNMNAEYWSIYVKLQPYLDTVV